MEQIIGEDYEFESMCDWVKQKDPEGVKCIHLDCWKARGYYLRGQHILERLQGEHCKLCGADLPINHKLYEKTT